MRRILIIFPKKKIPKFQLFLDFPCSICSNIPIILYRLEIYPFPSLFSLYTLFSLSDFNSLFAPNIWIPKFAIFIVFRLHIFVISSPIFVPLKIARYFSLSFCPSLMLSCSFLSLLQWRDPLCAMSVLTSLSSLIGEFSKTRGRKDRKAPERGGASFQRGIKGLESALQVPYFDTGPKKRKISRKIS